MGVLVVPFWGFKFVDLYRLFVVVELVPPRGGNELARAHKTRFGCLLGVFSKFSDKHPCHFYRGVPPFPREILLIKKTFFSFISLIFLTLVIKTFADNWLPTSFFPSYRFGVAVEGHSRHIQAPDDKNFSEVSYLWKNRSHLKVTLGKLSTSRVYPGKKSVV